MDPLERLASLFERFPGIGPRQAQRFVQFLLRSSPGMRRDLIDSVQGISKGVHSCDTCMRYFSGTGKTCGICSSPQRKQDVLLVVASDSDLLALERSGTFSGQYFVLGGTSSLASEKMTDLHVKELKAILKTRIENELREVVLAFPANPEGDATAVRLKEEVQKDFPDLTVTALGRGLSTGSELEYADPETIRSAIESRR